MIVRALVSLSMLLLLLAPRASAQGQLINGNRTLTGTLNAATTTGSANAYVLTLNPAITDYVLNQCFTFWANFTNTAAATLDVNGVGAKPLKKYVSATQTDLVAGDIASGQIILACYDGTVLQLVGAGGGSPVLSGAHFLTTQAEPLLSAEVTLGALPAGLLKHSVSGGASTPATAVAGTDYVVPGGTVALATALAANGGNCSTGNVPLGVDAAGAVEGCFDVATQTELTTGLATKQNSLGFTAENVVNKATTTALGTSDTLYPSQNAVKVYVDAAVAAGGGGAGTPGGSAGQAQYHGGAALAGSSGLTLNSTSILTRRDAVTAVSTDTTLGAHNIVLVTTGTGAVLLTLPSAAAPTVGQYVVVKADATLGELRVLPAGTDLLNARNGFISTDIPLSGFRLTWMSACEGWLAEPLNIPLRAEDLANGVSGTGFVVLQTSPVLLGGHILEMALTLNGHLEMRASLAPTVATGATDCGTAPSLSGNDMQGRVTVGTTPGGKCTLTFAAAWSQAPSCFCQNATAAQLCRGLNATTTTVELTGTLVAGNVLEFRCGANY